MPKLTQLQKVRRNSRLRCVAGCAKWGSLGFSQSKTVETRWWCAEHYPYWDEIKSRSNSR
ncbi:hypothetical protein ELH35_38665 [Rhizobium ruizarguesonis]|nr:hypothetical protein ELH35_38665 [Rhizobium ruizarguesonis]